METGFNLTLDCFVVPPRNDGMSRFTSHISRLMSHIARLTVIFLSFCISCTKPITMDTGDFDKKIVIEGYIENGDYAWVTLTKNRPFFGPINLENLMDVCLTGDDDVVVIVSDGTMADTLKFEIDPLVLQGKMVWPPVRFKGKKIIGEVGKSYHLTVIHERNEYTATTSIVTPYYADTIWFALEPKEDSLGYIHTIIHDNPNETNYYRYYTKRIGKDYYYTPGIMSLWDDRFFNGMDFEFILWRGRSIEIDYGADDPEDNFFRLGDTVSIKSCMMDRDAYWYWKTLGSRETLSNIRPESAALGVWCGYGAGYHTFVCE
ncbi:MAG: DUF4249 domain-containing protein [Bacteroidales bacterium]|nr:DUF4249 domain-containing protein [Bacteroidales bacterium]